MAAVPIPVVKTEPSIGEGAEVLSIVRTPSPLQRARDVGEITVGVWMTAASEIADRVSLWRAKAPELVFNMCVNALNNHVSKYL